MTYSRQRLRGHSDSPMSLSGVWLTFISLSARPGRPGCLARSCTLVLLPLFLVLATITAVLTSISLFLFGGSHAMADKTRRSVPRPDGEPTLPPCATAGDDRVGPESPPWVQPSVSGNGRGFLGACDPEFRQRSPTLHDFLTLAGWGGKQRKTGTCLVFAEDGKWKACLNDRDGGNYCFLASDSLEGLLGALEDGLKAGSLDWRASKSRR